MTFLARTPSLLLFFLLALTLNGPTQAEPVTEPVAAPSPAEPVALFATVNGSEISLQEYVQGLRNAGQNRFYHGTPPEAEVISFKIEVGDDLINRTLLLQEAGRREIQADPAWIQKQVGLIAAKYEQDERWIEQKDDILGAIRLRLDAQSRLTTLTNQIRDIAAPTEEQLQAYYAAHPDYFTSPERSHVSSILLKVDAWGGPTGWEAANEKAKGIETRLRDGESFEELAQLYSDDVSADQGGDLGFLHRGMLGAAAQEAIDALSTGEISSPVTVLEGVAIFRLEDREEPQLNPLSKVRDRAEQLWLRERRDLALESTVENLRNQAEIELHDENYLALPEELERAKQKQAAKEKAEKEKAAKAKEASPNVSSNNDRETDPQNEE